MMLDNKNYEAAKNWLHQPNALVEYKGYLNDHFKVAGYISLKDESADEPPEHVPEDIAAVFSEGATCVAVRCWNAGGAMFRLAIDMATKSLLPPEGEPPAAKIRRSLGFRLEWLFENGKLPTDLEELAECIKEDGNDGAHDGSLTSNDRSSHSACLSVFTPHRRSWNLLQPADGSDVEMCSHYI